MIPVNYHLFEIDIMVKFLPSTPPPPLACLLPSFLPSLFPSIHVDLLSYII